MTKQAGFRFFILGLVLLGSGVALWIKGTSTRRTQLLPEMTEGSEKQAVGTTVIPPARVNALAPIASPFSDRIRQSSAKSRKFSQEESWRRFQEKFGRDLKGEFTAEGQLTSVRGQPGQGAGAGTDFRPDDPQKAVARAREVLEAARELLGIEPGTPLEDPIARGSGSSAQVTLHEKLEGVPVEPYGNVTVDLGPQGELQGLDSTYIRKLHAANTPLLKPEQVRAVVLALASPSEPEGGLQLEGGNRLAWVSAPHAAQGQVLARHAYGFFYHGQQFIVDAADGKILSRRDQRNY